jgi:ribosomal protein S27AE
MAMGTEAHIWKCGKCDAELVVKKVVLEYLGHTVAHAVPCCPKCGKVLISQELAEGRMSEVEQQLEDK